MNGHLTCAKCGGRVVMTGRGFDCPKCDGAVYSREYVDMMAATDTPDN